MAIAVFLLSMIWYFRRRAAHAERQKELADEGGARQAIECTRKLGHSAVFVPAETFLQMASLERHETLRDLGKLLFYDTLSDLAAIHSKGVYYIFISHQWTSWLEPDPSGKQYDVMAAAVREITKHNDWPIEDVMVWCDYISIPQQCLAQQRGAIHSLISYASHASAFVVVAPTVKHGEEDYVCDVSTYRRRLWCRAEQLCYMLRQGTSGMWLATGTGSIEPLDRQMSWLQDNLLVFEGDATNDDDKLALVWPVLGLYAGLYAERLSSQSNTETELMAFIEANKERIFPTKILVRDTAGRRALLGRTNKSKHKVGFKRSGSKAASNAPPRDLHEAEPAALDAPAETTEAVLFGDLVATLEKLLSNDGELRRSLLVDRASGQGPVAASNWHAAFKTTNSLRLFKQVKAQRPPRQRSRGLSMFRATGVAARVATKSQETSIGVDGSMNKCTDSSSEV